MVNILSSLVNNLGYIIFSAFVISNLSIFKNFFHKNKLRWSEVITLAIIFALLGILGTYLGVEINGAIANTRLIGIMTGGIFFGPWVGIGAGIIAGTHRLFYGVGSITSVACAIATVMAGGLAGIINKKFSNYKKWVCGLVGSILMQTIEIGLILTLSKPYAHALNITKTIYFPMVFINTLGTCLLILLIQRSLNEKDQIAAKQAELALEIATKTLPYFRDINNKSFNTICSIINESTNTAAVSITDTEKILAHVGLGSDHHKCNETIKTISAKEAIQSGTLRIMNSKKEVNCSHKNCPLKSVIITPLKEGDTVIGTLNLYYAKENSISYTNEKLAVGLSQLISTQLEISKVSELKELATKSELKALQSQINPHFLFNSLNTIVSFMRFDINTARELIINLSNYLRYNFEEIQTFVDISRELQHVQAYAEIEKARFGEKLEINYDIDEGVHIKIPSLIIQPLVENSIKHGILEGRGIGTVNIKVKNYNLEEVKIVIEDNGIGIPESIIEKVYSDTMEKNKIGIANVNNRLKYIYGHGLTIERPPIGTRISFIIHEINGYSF